MTASPPSTPLLDDQPSTTDLLNFGQFVAAFESIILNAQTKTPFITGIFGRWGTGKTTLMRMLERRLETDGVPTAWFSAWLYNQEEHIWAAFLESLTNRLAGRLSPLDKLRLSVGVYRRGLAWHRLIYDLPPLLMRTALVAAPALAATLWSMTVESRAWAVVLQTTGLVGSAAAGVWAFLQPSASAIRHGVKPDFSLYRSMDFGQHVGFLDRFREQFARIVASMPGAPRAVVIFVDDLDRCGPEKTLQVLDTIKVFLDVPGCIFILGVDVVVIQQAIANKYPNDAVAQREYLSKIVQLPFHLPPLSSGDLRSYLAGLDVTFPDERCRAVVLESLSRNPRELKRVINTFSLHWYLAVARSLNQGKAVTPVRLAKVVVIQQTYAALFSLVREQPELLAHLERQYRLRAGETVVTAASEAEASRTQQITPTGMSLPPSLAIYGDDAPLIRLLTMHALRDDDDASFAKLSAEEIQPYFTLARTTPTAAPSRRRSTPAPPPGPTPVQTRPAPQGVVSTYPPFPAPLARAASSSYSPEVTTSEERISTGTRAISNTDSGTAPDFDAQAPDFGERYRVLRRLAVGGASQVYLAQDIRTGRQVAIKALISTLAADPSWAARFEREMRVASQLRHPNLVEVHDTGVTVDDLRTPFFVMEYVEGQTLDMVLGSEGALQPRRALVLLEPIFDALSYMHRHGVVHRDVKPSAIFVTAGDVPKLGDFGLALQPEAGRDNLTLTGYIIGTPAYMSPEQAADGRLDGRSDLFSLGVVVYESLTGQKPFAGRTAQETLMRLLRESPAPPSQLSQSIPKHFDEFAARILARDPDDRYQTAEEAKIGLHNALQITAKATARAT